MSFRRSDPSSAPRFFFFFFKRLYPSPTRPHVSAKSACRLTPRTKQGYRQIGNTERLVPFRQTTVSPPPPPPSQPPSPGCQQQAPAHTVSLPQGALLSGRAICYAVGSCPREHATVPSGTNNHLFTTFCQMHVWYTCQAGRFPKDDQYAKAWGERKIGVHIIVKHRLVKAANISPQTALIRERKLNTYRREEKRKEKKKEVKMKRNTVNNPFINPFFFHTSI